MSTTLIIVMDILCDTTDRPNDPIASADISDAALFPFPLGLFWHLRSGLATHKPSAMPPTWNSIFRRFYDNLYINIHTNNEITFWLINLCTRVAEPTELICVRIQFKIEITKHYTKLSRYFVRNYICTACEPIVQTELNHRESFAGATKPFHYHMPIMIPQHYAFGYTWVVSDCKVTYPKILFVPMWKRSVGTIPNCMINGNFKHEHRVPQ